MGPRGCFYCVREDAEYGDAWTRPPGCPVHSGPEAGLSDAQRIAIRDGLRPFLPPGVGIGVVGPKSGYPAYPALVAEYSRTVMREVHARFAMGVPEVTVTMGDLAVEPLVFKNPWLTSPVLGDDRDESPP